MKRISVNLPAGKYDIVTAKDLLKKAGAEIEKIYPGRNFVILSDDNLWKLYGNRLLESLEEAKFSGINIVIKPGEKSKTLDVFREITTKMACENVSRDWIMIALGGGVVGDMAGFVAAVYKRGIPVIQIPTSLIAQVDSSVGGKTALNLEQGKNLIGAFHQPGLVLIDPQVLSTLAPELLADGMAEVVKYGAALDEEFFLTLEKIKGLDEIMPHLEDIIFKSCAIKKDVVEKDEKDRGERRKLNYGHSFGHGIEKLGNYQDYTHGEAVAVGMVLAAEVGEGLGLTEKGTATRLRQVLSDFRLPIDLEESMKNRLPELVGVMEGDKKNEGGLINLVLLKKLGCSFIYPIEGEKLLRVMESLKL